MKVSLWYKKEQSRCRSVAEALKLGIARRGDITLAEDLSADAHFFYGMSPRHCEIIKSLDKPYFVIDLAYWHRGSSYDRNSYYKVCYSHWHPNKYLNDLQVDASRFEQFGVKVKPWRRNDAGYILLAGMGPKSEVLYSYNTQSWDANAVRRIRATTDRPIYYRPKPSWKDAIPIPGTVFSPVTEPLASVLAKAYCVVTHHSNVAVDALVEGVPCIAYDGAASLINAGELDSVESLVYTSERGEFFSKLAYCQWSIDEMASGKAWKWLRGTFLQDAARRAS